jgi:hypothetical protein
MEEWDPIGVNDIPEAADEYDVYVGDAYELLLHGASKDDMSVYLRNIEVERMGMIDGTGEPLLTEGRRHVVVSSLIDLLPYFASPS